MIIDLKSLKNNSSDVYESEIIFDDSLLKSIDLLKEIKSLSAKCTVNAIHPYLIVKIALKGELVLYSSRSLKDVPFSIDEEEDFTFLLEDIDEELKGDDLEVLNGNELDLTPYLFMLFDSSIPFKIVLEDEEESLSGDSWELISEDEYNKRKESSNNAFKDLEGFFDEEE